MPSVLKPWLSNIPFQMQGTILTAIRGPDGMPKEDTAKVLVRALRATVMNNAKTLGPDDIFMGDGSGMCPMDRVRHFFGNKDQYPWHWATHFMHAAQIVGYHHPNPVIRKFWNDVYLQFVDDIHVMPEPIEVMDHRLRRNGNLVSSSPCPVCGHTQVVPAPVVRCSNCLTDRAGDQAAV